MAIYQISYRLEQKVTMEQLHTMRTDELVKLLLSPELAKPVNAPLRQQVIKSLSVKPTHQFH